MNIIRISAGLGNQMFQYAFYLAMKQKHSDTGIDITAIARNQNGFMLEDIFNIAPHIIDKDEIIEIADTSQNLKDRIRRDLFRIKKDVKGSIYNERGFFYDSEVWNQENAYFSGFWQSWRYFDTIDKQLRENFTFKASMSEMNKAVAQSTTQCESVSIHIHRGNNKNKKYWQEVGSICSKNYYGWAMASIRQQLGADVHYFVFSDDMEWVKQNIDIPNATYVNWNKGIESYEDMHLMSLCKHNIICNNSISWWGAYLNNNPDKIVIAPEKWYRNTPTPDLIPRDWVTLPIG